MTRNIITKIIAGTSIAILELTAATLPILAQTMPDKAQLSAQITAEAQAQTSTINASSSSAPSNTTTVTNTGDNTSTSTTTDGGSSTSVNNQNAATVNQTTNAVANTGNNDASRNIAIGGNAGVITTGNATVNTTTVTQANTNGTAIQSSPSGCSSALDAVNTGNNATTAANCSANTTTLVNNGNTTVINQSTNALANTGGNTAARNISIGGSSGVITTGNASTNTNSLVTANGSVMLVGGVSNGHGPGSGASIVLASASDTAHYTALADANSFFLITNDNRATIAQTCGAPLGPNQLYVNASSCTANTGYNNSSRNIATGGNAGVINTGDAVLNVTMLASANSNGVTLAYAPSVGGNKTDIVNTGNNTDTLTSSTSNQTTAVENSNNAAVNQTVNAYANTGNNTASRNIAFGGNAGVITTGNATVNTTLGTAVNSNQTQLASGPAIQGTASDPYAAILNSGSDSHLLQTSSNNGAVTVTNYNLLSLSQNASTDVNTGFNRTNGSVGDSAGIISTGNADATVAMSLSGNENTTSVGSFTAPVPSPTSAPMSPTPTPTVSYAAGTSAKASTTTQSPLILGSTTTASNPIYSYYYPTYYPAYQGYIMLASRFPARYAARSTPTPYIDRAGHTTGIVMPGDVMAAETSPATLHTAQSQIAWILLSVLSSLVGIGVYVSRHSFLDPGLYR